MPWRLSRWNDNNHILFKCRECIWQEMWHAVCVCVCGSCLYAGWQADAGRKWGCSGRGHNTNTLPGSPAAHHACQNRNPCSFAQRDIISMGKWNLTAAPGALWVKATSSARHAGRGSGFASGRNIFEYMTNSILHGSYLSFCNANEKQSLSGPNNKRQRQSWGVGGTEDTGNGVRNAGHC